MPADQPNAIQGLLKPLSGVTETSDYLVEGSAGKFASGGNIFQVPRFVLIGPGGGGETIRLGIFAAIHGDEPQSAEALVQFLQELEATPQAVAGYHIYAYPVCNPTGFVAKTRHNANGVSLSEQFWNGSSQPEVYYLEREMGIQRFHGIISIHTHSHCNGFTVNTTSAVLTWALAQPAIQAAHCFLPDSISNPDSSPVGTSPEFSNFLTINGELNPVPFELHISIPKWLPTPSQAHGAVAALKTILDSYRCLMSIGQNL